MTKVLVGAALALAVAGIALASAPELELTTGTVSTNILGPSPGSVLYSNLGTCNAAVTAGCLGGWQITFSLSASSAPALTPYGIDLHNLAVCVTGACQDLVVTTSDIGYAAPSPTNLLETFTGSLTGLAQASQNAWLSQADGYFDMGASLGASPIENQAASPFAYANTTDLTVTGPFSLTIQDTFAGCSGSGDCASYSTEGLIKTAVPEPASGALFGGVLALLASRLWRRKAA